MVVSVCYGWGKVFLSEMVPEEVTSLVIAEHAAKSIGLVQENCH